MFPVEIRVVPALMLHGFAHRGPYTGIGPAFLALGRRLDEAGLADDATLWVGVYHDDPARTPPDRLRSHACCALPAGMSPPAGLDPVPLPAARAAVLGFRGPYTGLAAAWAWLFAEWLPASGFTPRGPSCEIYRTAYPAVPAEDQLTEIVVPLV